MTSCFIFSVTARSSLPHLVAQIWASVRSSRAKPGVSCGLGTDGGIPPAMAVIAHRLALTRIAINTAMRDLMCELLLFDEGNGDAGDHGVVLPATAPPFARR